MRVRVAVVADIVTALRDFLYVVGIFVNPVADEEECRLDVIFVENIEQLLCLLVAPRRIKGDRDAVVVRFHAVYRVFLRLGGGLHRLDGGGDRDGCRQCADQKTETD